MLSQGLHNDNNSIKTDRLFTNQYFWVIGTVKRIISLRTKLLFFTIIIISRYIVGGEKKMKIQMNWMWWKRSIPNNITLPTVTKHPTISPLPFSSRPFPVFSSRGLTSPGCKAGRPGIAVPVKKWWLADAYNGLDFPRQRSTSARGPARRSDPRPPLYSRR